MAEYVRPVYAGIGSISSGTLRPVDLIPNFLWSSSDWPNGPERPTPTPT